ncbi:MAG: hypothetical protein KF874_12690 [Rhizobiaceae bacterium]|nr:hypothetical protein [Rhizobiaceae bacterium]
MWTKSVGAILSILLICSTAAAQTAAEEAACKADYEKYCKGTLPGGGRIMKCLSDHMTQLTPECQEVVKNNAPK